jgi:hypothetical protein
VRRYNDESLGAFMESIFYERLNRYEEIESYARTIELDDATSYAFAYRKVS